MIILCYDITNEKILKYVIIKYITYKSHLETSYIRVNSVKKKLTDLIYIIDKNHNDSKLCQKVTIRKNLVHKLLFVHAQILETQFSYIVRLRK